jgi:hypothetical protein
LCILSDFYNNNSINQSILKAGKMHIKKWQTRVLTLFLRSALHPAYSRTLALWLWPFWLDKCRAVNPDYKK